MYTNAGHPPGYVIAASGAVKAKMASTSVPLGIDGNMPFCLGESARLEAGDTMLLCTDGIPEAMSGDGELFGEDRLLDFVRRHSHLAAREIVDGLYDAAYAFSGGKRLLDDFTVVIVKKLQEKGVRNRFPAGGSQVDRSITENGS
jgi:serine phosphatase RsbU (regulator of sigma subunit)